MSIGIFISQPSANSCSAAYRPVILRVKATKTDLTAIPPVVYCDIYFNDVFYKTLSKSQYTKLNGAIDSEWQFDIQDAAQEYLTKYLAAVGESSVVEATTVIAKALCKFRSSGLDVDGYITSEDLAPIQGTSDTLPTPGNGASSNIFYVVNSTLQHEDNQDLVSHLSFFKNRAWTASALPLTHRPDGYKLNAGDSDMFPILYTGANGFKKLRLKYKYCGQTEFNSVDLDISTAPQCNAIISVPIATQNAFGYLISWALVSGSPNKYYISTPAISGGAPHESIVTEYQMGFLPIGDNVVTVRPLCFIDGVWYFGAQQQVTITVDACVNAGLSGLPVLPDAHKEIAYYYFFNLTGTAPFTLDSIVKPDWMNITVLGNVVSFTGTPGDADVADDVEVSFDISNCAGAGTVSFDASIDVLEHILFEGNFHITNETAGFNIDNVSPDFYTITDPFPVTNGHSYEGSHAAFSSVIGVSIINAGLESTLQLIINGDIIEEIDVTGAGGYFFESVIIAEEDDVEIKLITA